jgi:pimeloyl-ACP methyl ester carboxylesterase
MTELQPQTGFLDGQGAPLYYEVAGTGQPLLLIHAGVADSRMWDDQFQTFAQQYRVVRYDLRGFGKSTVPSGKFANHEDVTALFEYLGIKQAHLIGISFGGLIALDFTLAHPEKVTSLVLGAPDVSGRESSSADVSRFAVEEEALLERGDLAGATELNLRMWLDVPRRTLDQVDHFVRRGTSMICNITPSQYPYLMNLRSFHWNRLLLRVLPRYMYPHYSSSVNMISLTRSNLSDNWQKRLLWPDKSSSLMRLTLSIWSSQQSSTEWSLIS